MPAVIAGVLDRQVDTGRQDTASIVLRVELTVEARALRPCL